MLPKHVAAIVLIVSLLSPWSVPTALAQAAEPDPELTALDTRIKTFLEGVKEGQAQTAYQELLAGSQLLKQKEALGELVAKTQELQAKYGEYRGFEQIAAKKIGSGDLILIRYLYKCRDFPVVWYFTFYRAPGETPPEENNYRVVAVRFDTELDLLGL